MIAMMFADGTGFVLTRAEVMRAIEPCHMVRPITPYNGGSAHYASFANDATGTGFSIFGTSLTEFIEVVANHEQRGPQA